MKVEMENIVRILATRMTATVTSRIRSGAVSLRPGLSSIALALAIGLGLAAVPSVSAGPVNAESALDAFEAVRIDVDAGQCDRAAERLGAIGGLESRARLVEGQCQVKAGRYLAALDALDGIRGDREGLSPEQIGDVELYRGVALYHLERYGAARTAFAAAEGLSRDEAQLSLYRGLLALRDGDNDRAAPALESAARLAPDLTEPVASYYAGLAWQGASERGRAREAYERVIAIDGDGPWGQEARKLLDSTELFPWFVRGSFGIEWDDNVLLRGDVTPLLSPVPDTNPLTAAGDQDWRGVWQLDAGIELFQSDDQNWSTGLTASYAGNAHVDLKDVNTHYGKIGAYLSRRLDLQTFLLARYAFGHAWVDENAYLQTHTAELSLRHTWTRAGTTIVLADILANDLRFSLRNVQDGTGGPNTPCAPPNGGLSCSPLGVFERNERDRDGVGYGFAIDHAYLVDVPSSLDGVLESLEIGGRYRFRYYDDEGSEWEHFSHILSVRINADLPLGFAIGSRLGYERRDFDNRSSFPDREAPGLEYVLSTDDREEDVVSFVGFLSKSLTENLSVSARYSYLDNRSNRKAYKYDRHVVGGYLNFRFD